VLEQRSFTIKTDPTEVGVKYMVRTEVG
jgi:hypothetical protein